ncbi:hypothetical protein FGIG_00392 [Fasciola gigantica]|uniref:Uncharacterized protein n=1 Tax=Fasciola gigantica TaxID=46835 RepID=A0A504YEW1_FASGI|nr:hypothetical protein FGIG_00392 [Fasciola gigantica]
MSSQLSDSVISSRTSSQVQTNPTAAFAALTELTEPITQDESSLSVLGSQSASRRLSVPSPNTFRVGDNYRQRDGQARRYLKSYPMEQRADILLNILKGAAYDPVVVAKTMYDALSEVTFDKLRETLDSGSLLINNWSSMKEEQCWSSR